MCHEDDTPAMRAELERVKFRRQVATAIENLALAKKTLLGLEPRDHFTREVLADLDYSEKLLRHTLETYNRGGQELHWMPVMDGEV